MITTTTDQNGNITIHFTFTGAILNSSSNTSAQDVANFATAAEAQMKNAYIPPGVQTNNLMFQSWYQTQAKDNSAGNYVNINQIHILQPNYNNGKLNQNNIPK